MLAPVAAVEAEKKIEYDQVWSPSVFCITLFCMDEQYEVRGLDLVAAAFAMQPDHDYCVLALPPQSTEMSLLSNFSHVQPTSRAVIPQVLRAHPILGTPCSSIRGTPCSPILGTPYSPIPSTPCSPFKGVVCNASGRFGWYYNLPLQGTPTPSFPRYYNPRPP